MQNLKRGKWKQTSHCANRKGIPYALEYNLARQVDLGRHTMFIGEIVGIVADSEMLGQNQLPDIEKVRPMLFGSFGSPAYYGIGNRLGNAFSVGNELRQSTLEKNS